MKGMNRIIHGSGFKGVLNYCFGRDGQKEEGVLVGGNMDSTTTENLATEFLAISNLRPDIQKPVWHNSLRLPEGETISNKKYTWFNWWRLFIFVSK